MNFDWEVEPVIFPSKKGIEVAGAFEKTYSFIPRFRKIVRSRPGGARKCPVCGAKTIMEHRQCNSCGHKRIFTWCKISEGYIVTCPHCKAQTSYGKEGCIHCGKPINKYVRCSCGTEHEIRDWSFLKTI